MSETPMTKEEMALWKIKLDKNPVAKKNFKLLLDSMSGSTVGS